MYAVLLWLSPTNTDANVTQVDLQMLYYYDSVQQILYTQIHRIEPKSPLVWRGGGGISKLT